MDKFNVPKERNFPGTHCKAPHVIVGDEAFPLKTYLIRPYPVSKINGDIEKNIFNYRLSRARRVSENAFGHLVQKFRIYFRSINLLPENVDKVILTTCILHNYIKDNDLMAQNFDPIDGEPNWENLPRQGGNAHNSAFLVRETYKQFFNSESGSLPWQTEKLI
ncbi:protein ALP1-like [Aphis craccivora]|uniref:Protein ALP1-like n=1 Tax=Aphis craccivora TaxID=307492 RepID=A0A6G0Y9A6_APHCR|nr:protein ALP1-like [Aphis craccivora]